jgi:glycosyltransferase involved in cell wall biosynthesis
MPSLLQTPDSFAARPFEQDRKLNVCVVSGGSCFSTGGLATYTRFLLEHLAPKCEVSAVARFAEEVPKGLDYAAAEEPRVVGQGPLSTRIIAPRSTSRPILRRLSHLTGRPLLQGAAIRAYQWAFARSLREAIPGAVDVVHFVGNGFELLGFAALSAARGRGAAFTVLPAVHPGSWGDSALDVRLYNQADVVFILSDSEREHLTRLGVEPGRLRQVGLGPATTGAGDGARFRGKHDLGDRPLILFVARKQRSKGYHALCEAMPTVLAAVPNCCLVTIGPWGEPPYPPVPASALLDLGKADEADKEDALAACDIFCMPSAAESFGIVYVEAWSYGKPVIGGPAPAVRELVSEGENGFCVDQESQAIAAAVMRLLRDDQLRSRLGESGRFMQRSRFTWCVAAERHLSEFRRVAAVAARRRTSG